MDDDPIAFLRSDPDLRPLVAEHGELAIEPAEDAFERFTVSIINQQLSSASAAAIRDRLFERFEVTPATMLAADDEALRETGLSRQKIRYIKNVAEVARDGGLEPASFEGMDDDTVLDELTGITGVGPWSAKMYLMFCLGRPDVFPVEDLGIRRGMQALFSDDMDREEMIETAERWQPYRSYAARYLWRVGDD